jgi:hypothetical protein
MTLGVSQLARKDKEDEVEPEAGSLEHERRRRGGATEADDGSGSSLVREQRRARESLGGRGKC